MRTVLATVLATFIVFATHLAVNAQGRTKVVIGNAALNSKVVPLWVAQEQGFFNRYNIEAELVYIRSAPIVISALATGEINVAFAAAGSSILGAAVSGVEIKLIAGFTSRVTHDLVVAPHILKPTDLRGKRFGVQSIGGSNWMNGMLALEHLGLEPQRDNIQILQVGDQSVLTQALEAGTIDAAVVDGVFSSRLQKRGFPTLQQLFQANIPMTSMGIGVLKSYLHKYPQVSKNILKALIEGAAYSRSPLPLNKSVVLKTIMKHLKISDPSIAEQGYEDIVKVLDRYPYPTEKGMRNVQRLMKIHDPRVANVNVKDTLDDQLVKELVQSGFIDQVYKAYETK